MPMFPKGEPKRKPTDKSLHTFNNAMRRMSKENEDFNPGQERQTNGPGAPPAGAAEETAPLTTHAGQTTRGNYATDSSTGAGRYMDHASGTFGMEPLDPEGNADAIVPKS